ncbi:hypothetical protein PTTG_10608, partial [Puccinia triticina 1-1 BBBD Race 1]
MPSPNNQQPDTGDGQSGMVIKEMLAAMLALQKTTQIQLQTTQKLNDSCLNKLEATATTSNIKTKTSALTASAEPKSDRIDLCRFKSDGPKFQGPFQAVEPFLNWIRGVQIHFTTRDISNNNDKLHVIGSLLEETNLLAFYATKVNNYIIMEKIQHITMRDTKSFATYSTRAQLVVYGMPQDLKAKVKEWQLLDAPNFKYSAFKQCCSLFYKNLPQHRFHPTNATLPSYERNDPDILWHIHAYLNLVGRCHFCKKTCRNAAGTCPGPCDRNRVMIPDLFVTPPKPPNYSAPRAWTRPQPPPRPLSSAPGRALGRPAGVATLTDEINKYPALSASAIA